MKLRLSERYIMALNLLLIASVAYFAALSVNDIISRSLTGGAPACIRRRWAPAPGVRQVHPRPYYDRSSKRDVFNLVPAAECPAGGQVGRPAHQVARHLAADAVEAVRDR